MEESILPFIRKSKQTNKKSKTFTLCLAALGRREGNVKEQRKREKGKGKEILFHFMCLDMGKEGEKERSERLLLLFGM